MKSSLEMVPKNRLSELLKKVLKFQSEGDGSFCKGEFPCFRVNKFFNYTRSDTNVFGTLSVIFILKEYKSFFTKEDLSVIDEGSQMAISNLSKYQNKDGLGTYNFWQTKPSRHFPNGIVFKYFKHFKLPDDVDDTALAYIVAGGDIVWLKSKLQNHIGEDLIYSTWFGQNMPIEHDVCTLCNLMYLLLGTDIPLNKYDEATLTHLKEVALTKQFLENPFWISRHYASSPHIIYYYARLLGRYVLEGWNDVRRVLLDAIPVLFRKEKSYLNKVILQTAWLKLTSDRSNEILNWDALEFKDKEDEAFFSFIGAPFAPLNGKVFNFLASKRIFQIGWKCRAHEKALLLENYILKN
jgi:hypothetical protein